MAESLEQLSYHLIEFLEEDKTIRNKDVDEVTHNWKTSSVTLSLEKAKNIKRYTFNDNGGKNGIYTLINDVWIGIPPGKYKSLQYLANLFINKESLNDAVDYHWLEDKIFDWTINAFKSKRITVDLERYILDKAEDESKQFTYFFRVESLRLERSLTVGNVELIYCEEESSESQLGRFLEKAKGETDTNKLLKKYFFDKVLAKVQTRGVSKRAKAKAEYEVKLSVNALKAFCVYESLQPSLKMFDPDFDFSRSLSLSIEYEQRDKSLSDYINIGSENSPIPIELKSKRVENLLSIGLSTFSDFIMTRRHHQEFDIVIENSIHKLGEIASTRNLHERSVKVVSLFEGVVIPKGRGQGKGLTILKNQILPVLFEEKDDIDAYSLIAINIFNIRDKYLHNRLELAVNVDDMFCVQKLAVIFIQYLIFIRNDIASLQDLYKHLNIPT